MSRSARPLRGHKKRFLNQLRFSVSRSPQGFGSPFRSGSPFFRVR